LSDWRRNVLTFWFEEVGPDHWWRGGEAIDALCRDRFADLYADKRQLPPESFLGDPLTALAAVILFDQLPRNMFRGHADQFMTDSLALAIAKGAVARGYDGELSKDEKTFLYMPYEHSENLTDQQQSMSLFTALGDDFLLDFAHKHFDLIKRFGRFPHRNQMLGREPRPDEIAAGDVVPW
jgi:uncharacterized protein (DUF924 family)